MNNSYSWIDSHCHLEMLKGSLDDNLEKSFQQGMEFCISIGTDHDSNLKIKKICSEYEQVYGTFGFHPHNASEFKQEHLDWIRSEILNDKKIVGIGECGFDLHYNHSSKSDQLKAFESQLALALEMQLPVIIHSREADLETREVLNRFVDQGLKGVVHCFTSDLDQAKFLLDRGFYLSFNGICTFPQADTVRQVLKYAPQDRILLETDSPFLSPVPLRGKPNFPGNVSIVGEYVADLLGLSVQKLARIVSQNTWSLFPKIKYEY